MAYSATSEDWYDLLELSNVLPAVFRGETALGETYAALARARQVWPGTNADYVAIIDGFGEALREVADAILEQERALSALRTSISNIEESVPEDFPGGTIISTPPAPVDRLLTQAEQNLLNRISEELEELAEEIEAWSSGLEDEAEEAEDAAAEAEQEAEDEEDGD